jgi:hypothetical protein
MNMFKKTALCILVSASLIACGGGGSDDSVSNNNNGTTGTTYKIENGAFQKGPFVAGTTVTIQELDDNLQATGKSYTTVTDATGRFSIENVKTRFVEVFANGFYFDELTNQNSSAPITLRAVLDLTVSASKPSVNTLTTMQTERLRAVKTTGKTFQEAESDSRNAVLSVFNLQANVVTRLDSINLTGTSVADEALLRATVALLQVASNQGGSFGAALTDLIAKLATDLKDDGLPNGTAKNFVTALQSAQTQVDTEFVRSLLQEYLGTQGQSEPQVLGTSPAPKLSQWIVMRYERVRSEQNVAPVIWLLRDDGTVWKWSLVDGQTVQQVTAFKDIISLYVVANTHTVVALDKAGNAYQQNTQAGQPALIDSGVKQIAESLYLKQNGAVMSWNKQAVPNIPAMTRLVSTSKGDIYSASGGVAKADAQLYYFQYDSSDIERKTLTSSVKIAAGKYSQAQLILTDKHSYTENASPTNPEYPAAILNGDTWVFLNAQGQKIGQPQMLPQGTVYTHLGGGGIGQFSPVFAGDGKLWYWSASAQGLVESSCTNIKKMHRAEVVLSSTGAIKPILYTATGVGNVSCPESSSFDHLTGKTVVDVFTLINKWVVAITSDKKLIARAYDGMTWQGKEPIYTVSEPQK